VYSRLFASERWAMARGQRDRSYFPLGAGAAAAARPGELTRTTMMVGTEFAGA
jgi:hypothetical protein